MMIYMPALWMLLVIFLVLLWFLSYRLYKPFGRLIHKIWRNSMDSVNGTEDQNEEEKKMNEVEE